MHWTAKDCSQDATWIQLEDIIAVSGQGRMLVTSEIVDTTSIARWVIIVFQPFHGRQKGPEWNDEHECLQAEGWVDKGQSCAECKIRMMAARAQR